MESLDRRQVLCGTAGGVLIAAALTACGGDDDSASNGNDKPKQATQGADGKTVLAQTSAVAVGGGVVVTAPDGKPIVVVQPAAGEFKAFSAKCTHQGTTVGAPKDNTMTCPNHGSRFSAQDGAVQRGPAAAPLSAVQIEVQGTDVVLA